jgi:hypothetical protein
LRSRSQVAASTSRGNNASTPLECGRRCSTAVTRPCALEYAARSGAPSARRCVSFDTWPCRKLTASGPAMRRTPMCGRHPSAGSGARSPASTAALEASVLTLLYKWVRGRSCQAPATQGARAFPATGVVIHPGFLANFACDAETRRSAGRVSEAGRGPASGTAEDPPARSGRTPGTGADALRRLGSTRPLH